MDHHGKSCLDHALAQDPVSHLLVPIECLRLHQQPANGTSHGECVDFFTEYPFDIAEDAFVIQLDSIPLTFTHWATAGCTTAWPHPPLWRDPSFTGFVFTLKLVTNRAFSFPQTYSKFSTELYAPSAYTLPMRWPAATAVSSKGIINGESPTSLSVIANAMISPVSTSDSAWSFSHPLSFGPVFHFSFLQRQVSERLNPDDRCRRHADDRVHWIRL